MDNATEGIDYTKVKKGLKIFLTIATVSALVVLAITLSDKTVSALRKTEIERLIIPFMFWILYILFESAKLKSIAKALKEKLDIRISLKIITTGIFLAAVTPFQISGIPFQLYLMKKEGVSIGKGSAVLIYRGIITYICFLSLLPVSLIFIDIERHIIIRILIFYVGAVLLIGIIISALSVFKPDKLESLIPQRFKRLRESLRTETKRLREGLLMIKEGANLRFLFIGLFFSYIALVSLLAVVPSILWSLGVSTNPLSAMGLQLLIQGTLLNTPSPGGTGVAEGIGALLFYTISPKHLLGVFIVLWRFFTFYLSALVGGTLLMREFRD